MKRIVVGSILAFIYTCIVVLDIAYTSIEGFWPIFRFYVFIPELVIIYGLLSWIIYTGVKSIKKVNKVDKSDRIIS
jgi:hypothetical protein